MWKNTIVLDLEICKCNHFRSHNGHGGWFWEPYVLSRVFPCWCYIDVENISVITNILLIFYLFIIFPPVLWLVWFIFIVMIMSMIVIVTTIVTFWNYRSPFRLMLWSAILQRNPYYHSIISISLIVIILSSLLSYLSPSFSANDFIC